MTSIVAFFMFLGTTPLLMLPAILAWTSKRPGRGTVLAVNIAYLAGALALAVMGVVGVAVALVAWLFLLAWAMHPPTAATRAATENPPDTPP